MTWREIGRGVRSFLKADYRSVVATSLFHAEQLHQSTTLTWEDRYPRIFEACRGQLGDTAGRILSFGCSTGEEVVTLRRYFPRARITGAEINRRALAVCRGRRLDDRIAFVRSCADEIVPHGPFDAIVCMAVLQRTPHTVIADGRANIDGLYPFWKFRDQVEQFDSWLTTGGLLVLHHTHYAFEDLPLSARYQALSVANAGAIGPRFSADGSRRPDGPYASIFAKVAADATSH
jgi:hypothetical protein